MNDNIDLSNIINLFNSNDDNTNDNNTDNISSNNTNQSTNSNDPLCELLVAIKPFVNNKKQEKLDSYLAIMNFKNILNLFGGDIFG